MTTAAVAEPRFLYVGGDPAIDLINTVDWTARGLENERLDTFEQATRWAEGADMIDAPAGRRLRRAADARPRAAAAALADLHQVRDVLHGLFGAVARGEPGIAELGRFNRLLDDSLAKLELASAAGGYRWSWRGEDTDPRAIGWRVLWSAACLLRSDEVGKVRVCGGDDCGWMYVDRSRNGLRRWCQMRTCGTREKTRRRREGATA